MGLIMTKRFQKYTKELIKSASFGGTDPRLAPYTIHCNSRKVFRGIVPLRKLGKERALYYLSCTLLEAELNYASIEKVCLALIFTIQWLRHYMQAHAGGF